MKTLHVQDRSKYKEFNYYTTRCDSQEAEEKGCVEQQSRKLKTCGIRDVLKTAEF